MILLPLNARAGGVAVPAHLKAGGQNAAPAAQCEEVRTAQLTADREANAAQEVKADRGLGTIDLGNMPSTGRWDTAQKDATPKDTAQAMRVHRLVRLPQNYSLNMR